MEGQQWAMSKELKCAKSLEFGLWGQRIRRSLRTEEGPRNLVFRTASSREQFAESGRKRSRSQS